MRTDRVLTVFLGGGGLCLLRWGTTFWRGVGLLRGICFLGGGGGGDLPYHGIVGGRPPREQTDTCENITFPNTPYAVGKSDWVILLQRLLNISRNELESDIDVGRIVKNYTLQAFVVVCA